MRLDLDRLLLVVGDVKKSVDLLASSFQFDELREQVESVDDEASDLLDSEKYSSATQGRQFEMEYHFQQVLKLLGEDIEREGLRETPARIAKAWLEMTRGLHEDPSHYLLKQFTSNSDNMVIVRDIPFSSICEHHFVPFVGTCHIGYIPGPIDPESLEGPYRITGLSKFPRLVNGYAARPQVQEELTDQIASAIDSVLNPQGVMVVMEAAHMCMSLRGVKAHSAGTITSSVRGLFATNVDGVKNEFLQLLKISDR